MPLSQKAYTDNIVIKMSSFPYNYGNDETILLFTTVSFINMCVCLCVSVHVCFCMYNY